MKKGINLDKIKVIEMIVYETSNKDIQDIQLIDKLIIPAIFVDKKIESQYYCE